MLSDSVGRNAMIADVVGRLLKPEEYVRSVLRHLYDCKRKHGAAWVRIGVTGEGKAPNYRTESDPGSGPDDARVYESFNGLSHKALSNEEKLVDENWSLAPTPLETIAELLGQTRNRSSRKGR
jgi:hypothetical protein